RREIAAHSNINVLQLPKRSELRRNDAAIYLSNHRLEVTHPSSGRVDAHFMNGKVIDEHSQSDRPSKHHASIPSRHSPASTGEKIGLRPKAFESLDPELGICL